MVISDRFNNVPTYKTSLDVEKEIPPNLKVSGFDRLQIRPSKPKQALFTACGLL